MHKYVPAPYAPLLGLAAHIRAGASLSEETASLSFFRQFQPDRAAAAQLLAKSQADAAFLLLDLPAGLPAQYYLSIARGSILGGCAALLAATGVRSHNKELLRREIGRLVVKNAFPRVLSCYACGSYGDFSVHRLPLAGYEAGLHIAREEILAQQAISHGLKQARKSTCILTRQQVQANPNAAIRSTKTGKPLQQWTAAHWQQITWRLGYTTLLDVLTQAYEAQPSSEPASVELIEALRTISQAYQQVFAAYLAEPAYVVVGEAYQIAA